MSARLIDRSPDLRRLRDEGYDVAVVEGYLLLRDVPYVNEKREIKRGVLISNLVLAGDLTAAPDNHVMNFAGEYPCHKDGRPIEQMRHGAPGFRVGALTAAFSFSAKPKPKGRFDDYYTKMTTYADILSSSAQAIDASVTAKTFPIIASVDERSVFKYVDTASSRAAIVEVGKKLALGKVAIIGVGGTGSYVLDLVAKTSVREIHLFDGDTFLQHNAFRAPGAASVEELGERLTKVRYLERIYSKMRQGVICHDEYLTPKNLHLLEGMNFAFVCIESASKGQVVAKLESLGISFVDVGMGVYLKGTSLGGLVRTTTSTPRVCNQLREKNRIPVSEAGAEDEYDNNIQIAELNALNAALAVIRWKKLFGFYVNVEREHFSAYAIDGNDITNEDQA
jgi:Domain of unknown function (DUF6791)/ThiF family